MKPFNEIIDGICEAIKSAGHNEELFNEIDLEIHNETELG
jgi:hypothetical protein